MVVGMATPGTSTMAASRDAAGAAASRGYAIGILFAALGVVAFSGRPVLIKLAYGYVTDPVTLIALRMVFAVPFFLGAALWTRGRESATRMTRRDLALVALLGFLGYYASSFLDFLGLQYIPAGLGRLLLFVYPTIVFALSAIFLKKPMRARGAMALLVAYAGLALVLSNALGGEGAHFALGAGLVFAGAAIYAVYLVAGSHVVHRLGSVRFTAYALSVASFCSIAQFLALRPFSALLLPLPVYAIAVVMALCCTVLPVFVTAEALRRIGANRVAMIGALGPVSTVLLGYLGLDEAMTPLQLLGGVLVLGGVLLVTLKRQD
jgi:drug/metabolite transporter (DMT)-like permease